MLLIERRGEAMSTSAGKKKYVLRASAPPFQPENPNRRFQLSASAREFQPNLDLRCLFLTFSNGFPLTESQIVSYFTRVYGPYVEDVFVNRPKPVGGVRKPALFGKIMFKHPSIPEDVMGTDDKVSISIDDIPVYCRRFVSQKTSNAGARRE